MAIEIAMPKLGLTMESGLITAWNKKDGGKVKQGDILFAIETDKITSEVEAESDGILHINVPEGATVPCGEKVAIITAPGEEVPNIGGITQRQEDKLGGDIAFGMPEQKLTASINEVRIWATPKAKAYAAEKHVDISKFSGTGINGLVTVKDVEAAVDKAPKASPLAARIAADAGVDLSSIAKDGRIMKQDVMNAIQKPQVTNEFPTRRIPMSTMRKAIARNMLLSVQTAPAVAFHIKADVSRLAEVKTSLSGEIKVSYTDLLVYIVTKLLMKHPYINGRIEGDEIVFNDYVNMGIAVALDDGLVVPVIKNANQKSLSEISDEMKELVNKARNSTLGMDDMNGGTFTITNIGMYGIDSFSPIINQPQSAILGVNTIEESPVIINGQIVVKPVIKLSLTVDHRIIDGVVAAKFLSDLKGVIEEPWRLFL